jgi:hypothetical protein
MTIEKIGVVLVRTFSDHIEVALKTDFHGYPRFFLSEVTKQNRYPFEDAIEPVRGVDVKGARIPNLTLLNGTKNVEFHFVFQGHDEIRLPPRDNYTWVNVHKWASMPWGPTWQTFIKEAYAVLDAFDTNYAIAAQQTGLVSDRVASAEHARRMVMLMKRPDLLFGVTVNLLMNHHPSYEEWYTKHRIDWLLDEHHDRANFIYDVGLLAMKRHTLYKTIPVAPFGPWYEHAVKELKECTDLHKELFGDDAYDFQTLIWSMISQRLFQERTTLLMEKQQFLVSMCH